MIIALIGLIVLIGLGNMWYYEYRVIKGTDAPKVIDLTGWKL